VGNIDWSAHTDWESVCRRAAGRRAYNAHRSLSALLRRCQVVRLLCVKGGLTKHGTQARLARQLGVSRSTICRDISFLLLVGRPCPHCGAWATPPETSEDDDVDEW
jgi:hypothetical protein